MTSSPTPQAQQFAQQQPGAFFLDLDDLAALQQYLLKLGCLQSGQHIEQLTRAGEGNMNLVLRVVLADGGRLIVKQSRPWVEKFPDIAAPAKRADTEGLYYRQTARLPAIAACSPAVLASDEASHIMVLEDLGDGSDLSDLYLGQTQLPVADLQGLAEYLSALHGHFTREGCDFFIGNHELRELNAVHMFRYPYDAETGFDLDEITPGLAQEVVACREDAALMAVIADLDRRYLQSGSTLLHGDFFLGSFLRVEQGLKVIDPEFCFFGDAEFDVGVLLAHLMLSQQPEALLQELLLRYQAPAGFSLALCRQYAGAEILRRLLGLAQLPLQMDLATKQRLVALAREMLLSGQQA